MSTTSQTRDVWWELRVLREKDGHSLTSLAAATTLGDDRPMSLGYLSDLENGRRQPNARVTKALARALNVPVSVLEKDRRDAPVNRIESKASRRFVG